MTSQSKRGFAAMDVEKQREIARKGGQAAHAKGSAHQFDAEEAREAGRKGGLAISRDRAHMAKIGAKGGVSRGSQRKPAETAREIEIDQQPTYVQSHPDQ